MGDNHYGGSQAFYTETIDGWSVTCRYGFTFWDSVDAAWQSGNCRYLQICEK